MAKSSSSSRRPPVPLLLESFPIPPSFIPPPPPLSPNPPPSGPPSVPLPPVPGPSRVSEQDTLLFLSTSRRNSKFSIASSPRPDSTLSNTSLSIGGYNRDSVSSSLSSHSHSLSVRSPRKPFKSSPRNLTQSITDLRLNTPKVPPEASNHDDILDIPLSTSPPLNGPDDSISSISMLDLPPAEDLDDDIPTTTPASTVDPQALHMHLRSTRSRSASHKRMLQARSTSPSRALASQTPSMPVFPPLPTSRLKGKKPPSSTAPPSPTPSRSSSPDVSSLLSRTPRPRRSLSKSRSLSRPRSNKSGSKSQSQMSRRGSEGMSLRHVSLPSSRRASDAQSRGRPIESAYDYNRGAYDGQWDQGDFIEDYGVRISGRFSISVESHDQDDLETTTEDAIMRLEKELEGMGSDDASDSDSSLDLHTPLPRLMARQGLLSPNSKLLSTSSPAPLGVPPSSPSPGGRPSSAFSMASQADSVMTKSGVIKDARDTPRRRVRHRDGKLLKGGLGLTTGLGWSDSEDEDAPSPLTRRISSLNLSRSSSTSSLRSAGGQRTLRSSSSYSTYSLPSTKHPLSRSYSHGILTSIEDGDDFATSYNGSRSGGKSKNALPPTSWHGTSSTSGHSVSTTRTSSASTLSVTIPEEVNEASGRPQKTVRRSASELSSGHTHEDFSQTPTSTNSSVSIPMPMTPNDNPGTPTHGSLIDREKTLPSLPNPRTGSIRYGTNPRKLASSGTTAPLDTSSSQPKSSSLKSPRSRSQTLSSTSSEDRPPMPAGASAIANLSSTLPRVLHLPNRTGDRPAIPVPSIPQGSDTSFPSQRGMLRAPLTRSVPPSPSATPTSPGFAIRPRNSDPTSLSNSGISHAPAGVPIPRKPRTGTGMVYRSSSHLQTLSLSASATPTRMRLPSTPSAEKSTGQQPIAL